MKGHFGLKRGSWVGSSMHLEEVMETGRKVGKEPRGTLNLYLFSMSNSETMGQVGMSLFKQPNHQVENGRMLRSHHGDPS